VNYLKGKKILLGITGGIAAYKSCELVRLLIKKEATVNVVMTENAKKFITPLTCQTLSQNPVIESTFDTMHGAEIKHITLPDEADAFVVAPATANFIGKLASGIADDFLSTIALAYTRPILIAPAMNVHMYENKIVQRNIKTLKDYGHIIIEPASGYLACGYEGKGRMEEPARILERIEYFLAPKDFSGIKAIVTAGPTREHIDPVRYISNPSTGKMGYALARKLAMRGARVVLISGPSTIEPPYGVELVRVTSAEEMMKKTEENLDDTAIFIGAAAVADFRPEKPVSQKMKKEKKEKKLTLTLVKTPDIISEVAKKLKDGIIVGFAAETENLMKNATEKMKKKGLDMIFANDLTAAGSGFGTETNSGYLINRDGTVKKFEIQSKEDLADQLLDEIIPELKKKLSR